MIHYALRCAAAHAFDGWFRDSTAFDTQASAGLVECPECGSTAVTRGLMAPAISAGRAAPALVADPPAAPPATVPAGAVPKAATGAMPAQLRGMLQRMRAEVERHCDYVGPDFAAEARKLARGESERSGIYGEATPAEAEALRDEGIEVGQIPWVPKADA